MMFKLVNMQMNLNGPWGARPSMKAYELTKDQQAFIQRMRQPFAIFQFLDKSVVAFAVSDGFCELFGFEDHAQACSEMNLHMLKNVHPDDTPGLMNTILRFGTEGGRL